MNLVPTTKYTFETRTYLYCLLIAEGDGVFCFLFFCFVSVLYDQHTGKEIYVFVLSVALYILTSRFLRAAFDSL